MPGRGYLFFSEKKLKKTNFRAMFNVLKSASAIQNLIIRVKLVKGYLFIPKNHSNVFKKDLSYVNRQRRIKYIIWVSGT